MKASFLFCRTSLSLHRKAAFLMPPKVQLENSFCIAKAYGFIYVSFILLTWNECINNTSPSNMSISAVAVAVASIWLCFFPFVIHFFSKKYVLMLGVMFQKNFMLLDALCGILLLGKKKHSSSAGKCTNKISLQFLDCFLCCVGDKVRMV